MAVFFKRFLLLFALWLVIALNDPSSWAFGAAAAGLAARSSLWLLPPQGRGVQIGKVLKLVPSFIWQSVLGGLDVAWRAFHPRLPLKPDWILYPVRVRSGALRVSLGNELSLMPGTLAAGSHGSEAIYVHCLSKDQPVTKQIAAEERRIADSLGLPLKDDRA
jgi:multicomponent Na+:H+ antiporter subunit E